jgi:diguanylate cyclase (GGDEF)-like protein
MTAALIALGASAALLVVVTLVALDGRRARRASEERLSQALGEIGGRMDELAHDLSGALERVAEEGKRARALGELTFSIDLDEVLARTVEAAGDLPGVDASIVRTIAPDGGAYVAALGVPLDEADAQTIAGPPDGTAVRAVAISYHYGAAAEPADALRSGLAVPLRTDDETIGFLAVYSRDDDAPVDADSFTTLELIAEHAGPAIENARRFRDAKQVADEDALTGLRNRRTFYDTLAREVARAQRDEQHLAVLLVDVDDFKALNDRIGHLSGDAILAEIAGRVRDALRPTDIACRIGGDEFAVILPEAGRLDAEAMFARIQAMLRRSPPAHAPGIALSGGIAELGADDDAISLFERADSALFRAKDAGKGTAA